MDPKAFRESPAGGVVRSIQGGYWAFVPNPLPPELAWSPDLVTTLETKQLPLFEHAPDVREVHNYVRALEHGTGSVDNAAAEPASYP